MVSIAIIRSQCKDPGFPYYTTILVSGNIWDEVIFVLKPLNDIPGCIEGVKKRTQEAVVFVNIREPEQFDVYQRLIEAGYAPSLKFKDNEGDVH